MKLIGISGKKQSGKDTVADCIISNLIDKNQCTFRIGFASALKQEVADATGLTVSYINKHKDIFRPVLQWWGTDFRRNLFGKDYWLRVMEDEIDKIPDTTLIIVTDVRFSNEATFIKDKGGRVIRISRITTTNDKHLSETELTDNNFPYNHTIVNDGTLDDLEQNVLKMLNKFKY